MPEHKKCFPESSLAFWDKLRIFSGLWEQVKTGGYLPIVVTKDGENLGTDGDPIEIDRARQNRKAYMISGWPTAEYIGCRETETATWLYWRDSEGNYYEDLLGVMEVERWYREVQKRNKKASGGNRMPGSEPIDI